MWSEGARFLLEVCFTRACPRIFNARLDGRRIVRRVNYDNKGVMDAALGGVAPKLTLVTSLCGNGSCPTVYRTDRGTLLVQGYAIPADQVSLDLPPGEQLVEIPADLLASVMHTDE